MAKGAYREVPHVMNRPAFIRNFAPKDEQLMTPAAFSGHIWKLG
uniref:Uncharacterized protein n=1 Tax=Parascaris equorum TaxID=6256 RepID=A0A914S5M0_PAREQ